MKTPQLFDERHVMTSDDRDHGSRRTHLGDGRRPITLTIALIVVAALIGGASVFAWDRTGSRDPSGALADAVAQRDAAQDQVVVMTDRLGDLRGSLTEARDRATVLEGRVSATEAELLAMLGPALPDGKHLGELFAVGADQEPPRLVIDIEQWFTDQAAFDAAEEDGAFLDHPYYIRNADTRWRTIEIDPSTKVSLEPFQMAGYVSPGTISLSRFGELYYSYEGDFLRYAPFWITVDDGKIVAIEGQFIS
jgi:hypothetical protein